MHKKKKGARRATMDLDGRTRTDVSLDDVRDMIWEALQDRDKEAYLSQVYGSYVIYQKDGKYFRLPYSILEGSVQFGNDPVEVERVWVEARNQQAEGDDALVAAMRLGAAQDPEGSVWEVTICEPGFTKNGWFLPEDVLEARETAEAFEGVDVNLYELPDRAGHVPDALFPVKSLLGKNKVGWVDQIRYQAGEGLKGLVHFLDSWKWIGRNLIEGMKQGVQVYGLSFDAPTRAARTEMEGKEVLKLLKFREVDSLDIVTRPAAGGKFNRAVAAHEGGEKIMDKTEMWNLIKAARPDLLTGKDLATIADEELTGLMRTAMEAPGLPAGSGQPGGGDPGAARSTGSGQEGGNPDTVTREEFDLFRCGQALEGTLAASDLPEHAKKRARANFNNRIFAQADLETWIAAEKDYLAQMENAQGGDGDPVPASRTGLGLDTLGKLQIAADRLFGLTQEEVQGFARMERLDHRPLFEDTRSVQEYEHFYDVPAFRSLMEMYVYLSGDPETTGRFFKDRLPAELRGRMDINSGTLTYLLGNTMGRRLVRAYTRADYGEGVLISVRKPVKDFRTQEAAMIGGLNKLEDVDPETGRYQEISAITDEEATYTLGQKGNTLTITRKFMIQDDITVLVRLIDAFGVAAAWTHADYVWDKFINNRNCSDGTAMFTSAHGNLGSSALTIATAYAGYTVLAKMTEKDSGRRLGLLDREDLKPVLVHPPDLLNKVQSIKNDDHYFTSNDLTTKIANPLKGKVNTKQCSLMLDTNDWGLLMPASEIDIVEMGYLHGNEMPEFFVADTPPADKVFYEDRIAHKCRHEYAGTNVNYRGAYKAVV